ncbi:hypothetical protein [Micromonospora rifamycinica]|uniref:hypothetical protein n=1 Tax=Micromonospora rifamycinica TaxID=291594 RepID=UPI00155FE360|nr:hypothetical protein [Micromonospora rifamycinica]
MLHLVVCAAPPVDRIGELVGLLMADGWSVCLIATPVAASWLDRAAWQNSPSDRYDMSVGVFDMRAAYTTRARSGLNDYARRRTRPPAIGEVAGDICELPTLRRTTRP